MGWSVVRVIDEREKIVADFREVAKLNMPVLALATSCQFPLGDEFHDDGLGRALGQTFQTSKGRQFSLIQHFQAPAPANTHTNIVCINDSPDVIQDDLVTILTDLDISAGCMI